MDKLGTGFFQSVDGAPASGYRAARGGARDAARGDDVLVVTGEYAAPILRRLFDSQGFGDVAMLRGENRFFGGNIKVAGLLTGQDLNDALRDVPSDVCLVPDVCLSEGRFLDGSTLDDLGRAAVVVVRHDRTGPAPDARVRAARHGGARRETTPGRRRGPTERRQEFSRQPTRRQARRGRRRAPRRHA